jgi:hypothetical protein
MDTAIGAGAATRTGRGRRCERRDYARRGRAPNAASAPAELGRRGRRRAKLDATIPARAPAELDTERAIAPAARIALESLWS